MSKKQTNIDALARKLLKAQEAFRVANANLLKVKKQVEKENSKQDMLVGLRFLIDVSHSRREMALNKEELIAVLGMKFVKSRKLLKKVWVQNMTVVKRKK